MVFFLDESSFVDQPNNDNNASLLRLARLMANVEKNKQIIDIQTGSINIDNPPPLIQYDIDSVKYNIQPLTGYVQMLGITRNTRAAEAIVQCVMDILNRISPVESVPIRKINAYTSTVAPGKLLRSYRINVKKPFNNYTEFIWNFITDNGLDAKYLIRQTPFYANTSLSNTIVFDMIGVLNMPLQRLEPIRLSDVILAQKNKILSIPIKIDPIYDLEFEKNAGEYYAKNTYLNITRNGHNYSFVMPNQLPQIYAYVPGVMWFTVLKTYKPINATPSILYNPKYNLNRCCISGKLLSGVVCLVTLRRSDAHLDGLFRILVSPYCLAPIEIDVMRCSKEYFSYFGYTLVDIKYVPFVASRDLNMKEFTAQKKDLMLTHNVEINNIQDLNLLDHIQAKIAKQHILIALSKYTTYISAYQCSTSYNKRETCYVTFDNDNRAMYIGVNNITIETLRQFSSEKAILYHYGV